ncbi:MAG: hypothetical protein HYZ00_08515, partial [Candidatus Hydrogenedentes bacterium]|nr:hypothetical protein [Candidatus Hydrogenedentota bacterium]
MVAGAAALFVLRAWLLDEARLQTGLVDALSDATGFQAELRSLQLHLFPRPHLQVRDLRLVQDSTELHMANIDAVLSWAPLLRGVADVDRVALEAVRCSFSDLAQARAVVADLSQKLKAHGRGTAGSSLRVSQVALSGVVAIGGLDYVRIDGQAAGLAGSRTDVGFEMAFMEMLPDARVTAQLSVATTTQGE